jgi:hypothetical protein
MLFYNHQIQVNLFAKINSMSQISKAPNQNSSKSYQIYKNIIKNKKINLFSKINTKEE